MQKLSHRRVLLLFIITPAFLFVELVLGYVVYMHIQYANQTEAKNTQLDTYLRINTKYISNAESAQRGYLLTGDTKFLETFKADTADVRKNEEYYNTLPPEIKKLDLSDLKATSYKKIEEMSLTIVLYNAGMKDSALAVVNTGYGKRMMDTIRVTTTILRAKLSDEIVSVRRKEDQLFFLFLGLITGLIVFDFFLVWYTYQKFKNYSNQIESMVSSLQDANQRMSQYTSMSYHELKTPLRNISGFAQLLRVRHGDTALNKEETEFTEHIITGVKQMNTIITDMRSKYLDTDRTEKDID